MNLETKITIYKFTPQVFTLTLYLPLSSVYFPVLLFISFFLVILLLSLRNKTGEKRYFL